MVPAGENKVLVQSFLAVELCHLKACAEYGGQGGDQRDFPAAITQVPGARHHQPPVADQEYGAGLGILPEVGQQV